MADIVQTILLKMKKEGFEQNSKSIERSLKKMARESEVPITSLRNSMARLNLEFKKSGKRLRIFDQLGGKRGTGAMVSMKDATQRLRKENRRFKAEYLSLMFLFMSGSQVFAGQIQRMKQLTGQTQIMEATMTQALLPVEMQMTKATIALNEAFMGLPQPVQTAIGVGIKLFDVVAKVGFGFYQLRLGLEGIRKESGSVSNFIKGPFIKVYDFLNVRMKKVTKTLKKNNKEMKKSRKGMSAMRPVGLGLATTVIPAVSSALSSLWLALVPVAIVVGSFIVANAALIVGIGLLVAALVVVVKNWELIKNTVTDVVENVWNKVTETFDWIKEKISTVMDNIWIKIQEVWDNISGKIGSVITNIINVIESSKIYQAFSIILDNVLGKWGTFKTDVKNTIDKLISEVNTKIEEWGLDAYIKTVIDTALKVIQPFIDILERAKELMDKVSGSRTDVPTNSVITVPTGTSTIGIVDALNKELERVGRGDSIINNNQRTSDITIGTLNMTSSNQQDIFTAETIANEQSIFRSGTI